MFWRPYGTLSLLQYAHLTRMFFFAHGVFFLTEYTEITEISPSEYFFLPQITLIFTDYFFLFWFAYFMLCIKCRSSDLHRFVTRYASFVYHGVFFLTIFFLTECTEHTEDDSLCLSLPCGVRFLDRMTLFSHWYLFFSRNARRSRKFLLRSVFSPTDYTDNTDK